MDQGLAAVLGATGGVVGTLGTAVFAYAAARMQTRDAGMVEHGHWLREKRLAACSAFLETLTQVEDRVHSDWSGLRFPKSHEQDKYPELLLEKLTASALLCTEQANLLEQARAGLIQFGPTRLVEISSKVVLALRSVGFETDRRKRFEGEGRLAEEDARWWEAGKAFRAAVRDVMESPPRRRRAWGRRAQ